MRPYLASEVKRVGSQPAGSGGQRWARIGPTHELVGADISNSDGTYSALIYHDYV